MSRAARILHNLECAAIHFARAIATALFLR